MAASTLTLDMPERLTFETAAAHVTKEVPIAEPTARVRQIREALTDLADEGASHLVICRAGRFLGIVTIEHLLRASGEWTVESLMDREAPFVAPARFLEQSYAMFASPLGTWIPLCPQRLTRAVVNGAISGDSRAVHSLQSDRGAPSSRCRTSARRNE